MSKEEQILALYKEGKSFKTIIEELGVSQYLTLKTLKDSGLRLKGGRISIEQVNTICSMYKKRHSIAEIKEAVNVVSVNTIYSTLRKKGIKLRFK